jgi:hypothetical protein
MRFISVPRRAKYVVRPTTRTMNALGMPEIHKGLQARFLNHIFDSEKAQTQLGWTDEERKAVERYMMSHRDYGAHNGFYLEEIDEEKGATRVNLPAGPKTTRCIAFFRNEDKEIEQCPKEATVGDYCADHAAEEEELAAVAAASED